MTVLEAFSTRLKALREEQGLSQDELGKKIGVSRGSISFYEKRSRTPDIITLDRISKFFKVSLDYLMGYSDSKTSLGVSIEKDIGLSEDSIEALRIYKLKYTPDDIKILNKIIQHQDIMRVCFSINSYNKNTRIADRLQTLITNYLKTEIFYVEHDINHLREYLTKHDMILEEEKLLEINEFVKSYDNLLSTCAHYTAGAIDLIPIDQANVLLINQAEQYFNDIIEELICIESNE